MPVLLCEHNLFGYEEFRYMKFRESRKKEIMTIVTLALPVIIENILQSLLGTTDMFFAGQIGDNAIAGISVTNMIMNIFISFFTAVAVGSMAVIARNYGRKDYKSINSAITQAILLGGILGISCGIVCLVFHKPILKISGADRTVIEYAIPYYMIVAVPSVILCLQLILSSCLRAIKDTKTPMYITGISNILNIVLNYCFVKLGLGIVGLGLATTVSRLCSMLFLFIRLKNYDKNIRITGFKPERKMFSDILKIGIPAGVEKLIMRIGQLVYNSMIISLGTTSYVAHHVAGSIESYAYIPFMGFGMAVCTLVGVSLGEKKEEQAERYTYTAYWLACSCIIFISIIFYIFAPQLAALFTKTEEVQHMVVRVLRIIAFFQPFSALAQIITNALQGAGDTKFPMYSTFVGIWGIRVGIGYVFAVICKMGLTGVWCAYATDLTVRAAVLFWRFKQGKWKEIKI